MTLLHLAAAKGYLEINQTIFNNLVISNFSGFNPRNNQGSTPLFLAAAEGHLEICRLSITSLSIIKATDINPRKDVNRTPLHVQGIS